MNLVRKNIILIIALLSLVLLLGSSIYFYSLRKQPEEIIHAPCLSDDEFVDYSLDSRYDPSIKIPKVPVIIFIRDIKEEKEKFKFEIGDVAPSLPIEVHKCGVYVIREFNFDYKNFKPLPGFRDELWRFDYSGNGILTETLFKKEGDPSNFTRDFRVDPTEAYLALERSYLGNPNYAFVIKDLKTREDVFVLTLDELVKKYSVKPASIGLGKWRDNGRYFWAVLFEAPHINAYIRITTGTWKVDVLPTPEDYTGAILSSPTGEYIVYDNGPGFIGIDIVAQQIYEEWRREGKKVSLFIYNLFTKEKITLATIDDPEWDFKTKWISGAELEYELPDGEKKIYKINNQ
ncbi:MAG: hypothetical protein ACE5WD_10755 [Candidatus Aminicenantia bacterium]